MNNSIPITTTNTVGEGFGGRALRLLGKLFGRRVVRGGDELILPDTREGRALRILLTGFGGSSPVRIETVLCRADSLMELRELLDTIIGQARPELDQTRAALEECGVKSDSVLTELSCDEWVTPERVRRIWDAIKHSFAYRWANNPQGQLVLALRRHQDVEPDYDDSTDGWSYVTGKYANEIEF